MGSFAKGFGEKKNDSRFLDFIDEGGNSKMLKMLALAAVGQYNYESGYRPIKNP